MLHGTEGDGGAGRVAEAHAVRHGNDQPRRHVDEVARESVGVKAHHAGDVFAEIVAPLAAGFASAAGEPAIGNDAIARLERGDAIADRRDLAGGFDADDERKLALGERHAAPAPHVEMIEPDRLDADLHLALSRRGRLRHLDQFELAVGNKRQRTHSS